MEPTPGHGGLRTTSALPSQHPPIHQPAGQASLRAGCAPGSGSSQGPASVRSAPAQSALGRESRDRPGACSEKSRGEPAARLAGTGRRRSTASPGDGRKNVSLACGGRAGAPGIRPCRGARRCPPTRPASPLLLRRRDSRRAAAAASATPPGGNGARRGARARGPAGLARASAPRGPARLAGRGHGQGATPRALPRPRRGSG